jgi:hypothetical protein
VNILAGHFITLPFAYLKHHIVCKSTLLVQNLELFGEFCFLALVYMDWFTKHNPSILRYPSFVHIMVLEVTQQAVQFGNKIRQAAHGSDWNQT